MIAHEPFNVVHVVRSLEVGGLERLVCDLVLERGITSTSVICMTTLGRLGEALVSQGGDVHVLRSTAGGLAAATVLSGALRRCRPSIVHCHNMFAHLYGALAARIARDVPVVLTKHGMVLNEHGLGASANRRLLRRTTVVGVSSPVCDVIRNSRIRPKSIQYIPNGVRIRARPVRHSSASTFRNDTFVFGTVARLAHSKDFDTLLSSIAAVVRAGHHARLVIVGNGPRRDEISSRATELGLASSVELLGERGDVEQLLTTFDAFVLSSHQEGIPMTVLEAMEAGLPVIATAVGGVPDVVVDGETGLLVPPKSPEALASAMLELIRNPDRAWQMGIAGRRRAEEQFDLRQVVARYEALYQTLLQSKSARRESRAKQKTA